MQKRLSILLVAVFIAGLSINFSFIYAVDDPNTGTAGHAQYYPTDTVVFASVVIDEAHFQQINEVIRLFTGIFNEFGVPNMTLEQGLSLGSGMNAEELLAWLGETVSAGVSVSSISDPDLITPELVRIVIEIEDRAAAQAFIEETAGLTVIEDASTDGATVYATDSDDAVVILMDDKIVINAADSNIEAPPRDLSVNGEPLSENGNFQAALANMSAPSYNVLAYITPQILAELSNEVNNMPPAAVDALTPQMYGATIVDGNNLVIDAAVLPSDPAQASGVRAVNPEFLQFIPADSQAVIQAADFTGLYYGFFDLAASLNTDEPYEDPRPMIEASLAQIGIDLQADLLDWATGDYALFMRSDIPAIATEAYYRTANFEGLFDFGVVMEATDPAAAQRLTGKLSTLIAQAVAEQVDDGSGQVTTSTVEVSGETLTSLVVEIPLGQMAFGFPDETLPLEFLFGATDDVFMIATRGAAEQIINQTTSLADTAAYQQASAYFLPDASSVWFTSGEGLIVAAANPLLFLGVTGPVIGEVFTDVVGALGATPVPTPTPPPTPTPDPQVLDDVLRPLESVVDAIGSSSLSTAVTGEGVTRFRAVLTLNLER